MSAKLVISTCSVVPAKRRHSRMSGCLITSIDSASSVCEYLRHEARLEELVNREVDELVDGRGDDRAVPALVEVREVRAAAAEADAERCLADDHRRKAPSTVTASANASRESN
jgi:hypothetical protein